MNDLDLRTELKPGIKRLVIKIGSAAISSEQDGVDQARLAKIVEECHKFYESGIEVLLVSSGAIQAGRTLLKNHDRNEMAFLQACSAVGQPLLMEAYRRLFSRFQINCAQVLLTHDDVSHRQRYLNLRNTLLQLLETGAIPIMNENDSVSFEEITVGDNDQLAAMAAEIVSADCLVMLTGPDGLYTADPALPAAKKLSYVPYQESLSHIKTNGKSSVGRGGMRTKLEAVRKLTPLGIPVIIATYKDQYAISRALSGGGTFFEAAPDKWQSMKKRWLLSTTKSNAYIHIDAGAYSAILSRKSLLPSGLLEVKGTFRRGDCIQILYAGKACAIGLSEYASKDLLRLIGRKSYEIESILGVCPSKVVVHSNNLVLKD